MSDAAKTADPAAEPRERASARPYQLGKASAPLRLPMLEIIDERIARGLRAALSTMIDRPVEVAVQPVAATTYGAFTEALSEPTNLNVLEFSTLPGQALLVCDPALLLPTIDLMFGGSGQGATTLDGRDFSITESRIIQRIVRLFGEACAAAWRPVHELAVKHRRSEMNARMAVVAAPTDPAISITFDVRIGDAGGAMRLCIPAATLEPVRSLLVAAPGNEPRPPDRHWQARMTQRLQSAQVEVSADFAYATATVADLLRLKVGDFIELSLEPTVVARVDDVPMFECRYGVSNNRYAIRIESFLSKDGASAAASNGH